MYLSMFLYQVPLLTVGVAFIPVEAFLIMQFGSPLGFVLTEVMSFVGGYVVAHEKLPISIRVNEYEEGSRTVKCIHLIHNFVSSRSVVSIEQFKPDDIVLENVSQQYREKIREAIQNYNNPNNPDRLWVIPLAYPYVDPVTGTNMMTLYVKSRKEFASIDTLLFRDTRHVETEWSVKGCNVKVSPYVGSFRCIGRDTTSGAMFCTPKDTQQEDDSRMTWDDAVALDVSIARPALSMVGHQQREIDELHDREVDNIDFQIISVGERVEMESLGKRRPKILPNLSKYRWYIAVGVMFALLVTVLVVFI
jgi:hypothetical protein